MARTTTEDTSCVKGYEYDIQGVNIFRIEYRSRIDIEVKTRCENCCTKRSIKDYLLNCKQFKLALNETR